MQKESGKENILKKSGDTLLNAILNAVLQGYTTKVIMHDLIEEIENGTISKGKFVVLPETLQDWAKDYVERINEIVQEMQQYEMNDPTPKVTKKDITTADLMVDLNDLKKKVEEKKLNKSEESEKSEEPEEKKTEVKPEVKEEVAAVEEIEKKSSVVKIKENWQKSNFDEDKDILSGELTIIFNEDFSNYVKDNQLVEFPKTISSKKLHDEMLKFLYKQYSWLRKNIHPDIERVFSKFIEKDATKGIFTISYVILRAASEK